MTENELRELADAIVAVLERGSLTPDAMRECLPPQLYRSLGEEGKRLGESSTLTAALRQLLKQGEIQRFPIDQRLDTNRYAYKLFVPNPHAAFPLPENEDDVQRELARHFFRWAGPATIKEFAWWAGMSQKEAKRAMHPLALAQASISEWSEEAWVVEEDMNALRATPDLEHKTLNLIPVRDNYLSFRRGMSVFASLEDRNTQILDWRNRLAPVAGLESIHNHTIIARGLLAGLWEYDADRGKIVWTAIGSLSASQRRAIHDQIEGLEAFIREELGDVQFYALDRGRQRQERIKAIRCM